MATGWPSRSSGRTCLIILRRDLAIIRCLAVAAAPILPLNLGFGLAEIIDEFGRTLFEEIDYHCEADNAERFAACSLTTRR